MSQNQAFLDKLEQARNSREQLTALMAEIDETKRALKSHLSQLSSEPTEKHARGRERQALIRRIKDKLSFLTEEREMVRARLGQIKMDQKALNRRTVNTKPGFANAFMAAAERLLSDEQFSEIEARAAQMLQIED